jgi:hypothetical protein
MALRCTEQHTERTKRRCLIQPQNTDLSSLEYLAPTGKETSEGIGDVAGGIMLQGGVSVFSIASDRDATGHVDKETSLKQALHMK